MDLEKKARTPVVKVKRLSTAGKTKGLPERWIERLESTTDRVEMSPTITVRSDATVLLVEALYWGVRCMTENIARDAALMVRLDKFLASIGK
jgi:hypothetical protein